MINIGVDNKAKEIKNLYIGVDNKAKQIVKAFIGVNGKARKIYELLSNMFYILDSENEIVKTPVKRYVNYSDYGDSFYINDNNVLTTRYVNGHTLYCLKLGVIKNDATKMYIEIEGSGALSESYLNIILFKNVATQLWSSDSYKSYNLINQPYTNLPKTVIEIDISDLDNKFFIGFHKADITPKVYKIYFNDIVEFENDTSGDDLRQYNSVSTSQNIQFNDGENIMSPLKLINRWERLYKSFTVEKNTDYVVTFKFCSPTGYQAGVSGMPYQYVYVNTTAPNADKETEVNYPFIAKSRGLDTSPSNKYQDYEIKFNSGNYTTLYLNFDFGYMQDYTNPTVKYKNINIDMA